MHSFLVLIPVIAHRANAAEVGGSKVYLVHYAP